MDDYLNRARGLLLKGLSAEPRGTAQWVWLAFTIDHLNVAIATLDD